MAKRKAVDNKTPPDKPGRLRDGLTWRLSDPGMGLLERAGLAALYMSLRAAEEMGVKDELAPLTWSESDLKSDSVTVRSTEDDKSALMKLFEWAWQVREGVLFFPAVHRDTAMKDNRHLRVATHNGVFSTFLQHINVQPKLSREFHIVELDVGKSLRFSFERPARRVDDLDQPLNPKTKRPFKKKVESFTVRPVNEVSKLLTGRGELQSGTVELSSWVFPGIAPRYDLEQAWEGPATTAVLNMLAPIACVFQRLPNEDNTSLVVVPDVQNLEDFDLGRNSPTIHGDPVWTDLASLSDAGLRFLSIYQTRRARQELSSGCRIFAMGTVGFYNKGQCIRKGVVDIASEQRLLRRYRLLEKHLGNRWCRRRMETEQKPAVTKKKSTEKSETGVPEANGFISVPTVRGRIADNLILGQPWYFDLAEPLRWDHDALERQRKRRPGISIERIWYENLSRYQKEPLMNLIREDEMWDDPLERDFAHVFWEILGALYYREKEAVDRGGSRSWGDRIEDLNEDIRRNLTRAKTGPLLRETISELLARPVEKYRSPTLRQNPGLMWRLIDRDWKRGRDLALLALASYQNKEKREGTGTDKSATAAD
ncbi:MAG: type I-MYXAN CRISPR-associated Cas8a1/Cmx1 [Planctomycetaceae bacterium]